MSFNTLHCCNTRTVDLLTDDYLSCPIYTVKAAKKLKSCLCCIPGEGDEEDEDDEDANEGSNGSKPKIDLSVPGAFATNTNRYVDGKAGFAFDPTKFSK